MTMSQYEILNTLWTQAKEIADAKLKAYVETTGAGALDKLTDYRIATARSDALFDAMMALHRHRTAA